MPTKAELHEAVSAALTGEIPQGTRLVARDVGPVRITKIDRPGQMGFMAARMALETILHSIQNLEDTEPLTQVHIATIRQTAETFYKDASEATIFPVVQDKMDAEKGRVLAAIDALSPYL